MISLIILLIIIIGILGYTSYNLFTKVEKLEQMVDSQDQYIQRFSNAVGVTNKKLEDIDEKGSFKSDDEIGWFFESLKTLQSELNDFNIDGARK
jgi:5,10-methylenetetrahydrofolate reductase